MTSKNRLEFGVYPAHITLRYVTAKIMVTDALARVCALRVLIFFSFVVLEVHNIAAQAQIHIRRHDNPEYVVFKWKRDSQVDSRDDLMSPGTASAPSSRTTESAASSPLLNERIARNPDAAAEQHKT